MQYKVKGINDEQSSCCCCGKKIQLSGLDEKPKQVKSLPGQLDLFKEESNDERGN